MKRVLLAMLAVLVAVAAAEAQQSFTNPPPARLGVGWSATGQDYVSIASTGGAPQSAALPNPPPASTLYGYYLGANNYEPISVDASGNLIVSPASFTPNQLASGLTGGYYMGTAPTAETAFGDSAILCANGACTNPALPAAQQGYVASLGVLWNLTPTNLAAGGAEAADVGNGQVFATAPSTGGAGNLSILAAGANGAYFGSTGTAAGTGSSFPNSQTYLATDTAMYLADATFRGIPASQLIAGSTLLGGATGTCAADTTYANNPGTSCSSSGSVIPFTCATNGVSPCLVYLRAIDGDAGAGSCTLAGGTAVNWTTATLATYGAAIATHNGATQSVQVVALPTTAGTHSGSCTETSAGTMSVIAIGEPGSPTGVLSTQPPVVIVSVTPEAYLANEPAVEIYRNAQAQMFNEMLTWGFNAFYADNCVQGTPAGGDMWDFIHPTGVVNSAGVSGQNEIMQCILAALRPSPRPAKPQVQGQTAGILSENQTTNGTVVTLPYQASAVDTLLQVNGGGGSGGILTLPGPNQGVYANKIMTICAQDGDGPVNVISATGNGLFASLTSAVVPQSTCASFRIADNTGNAFEIDGPINNNNCAVNAYAAATTGTQNNCWVLMTSGFTYNLGTAQVGTHVTVFANGTPVPVTATNLLGNAAGIVTVPAGQSCRFIEQASTKTGWQTDGPCIQPGPALKTATTITSTSFVTTNLVMPQALLSQTLHGHCALIWEQTTGLATVSFGAGMSNTPTGLWISSRINTSAAGAQTVAYTTQTATAATIVGAAATPGVFGTGYYADFDFVLQTTNTNPSTLTWYGLTSNASDALVLEPGSYCAWLP